MRSWSERLVLGVSDPDPGVRLGQDGAVPELLCSSNPDSAAPIQLPGEDLMFWLRNPSPNPLRSISWSSRAPSSSLASEIRACRTCPSRGPGCDSDVAFGFLASLEISQGARSSLSPAPRRAALLRGRGGSLDEEDGWEPWGNKDLLSLWRATQTPWPQLLCKHRCGFSEQRIEKGKSTRDRPSGLGPGQGGFIPAALHLSQHSPWWDWLC